jgi:hypothetical protein
MPKIFPRRGWCYFVLQWSFRWSRWQACLGMWGNANNTCSFSFQLPPPAPHSPACAWVRELRWWEVAPGDECCARSILGTGALNCLKCILFVYISQRKMPVVNAPGCLYVKWWSFHVLKLRGHYQWYFQVRMYAAEFEAMVDLLMALQGNTAS